MIPSPDQTNRSRFIGQIKEFFEFQKEWGRSFFPKAGVKPEPPAREEDPGLQHAFSGDLSDLIKKCQNCRLARNRRQAVPGFGPDHSGVMFIGEGPGFEEDQQGRPFVGPAGQLLTKMIQAIDLRREDVYITNVVKCRPPENRTPLEEEIIACRPFLEEEIRRIDPKILVALGSCAAQTLSGTSKKISDLRGHFLDLQGRRFIATYHPAYLLRNPGAKRGAWEDLKKVRREYDALGK
jgi:uracil-DNA glycosylase